MSNVVIIDGVILTPIPSNNRGYSKYLVDCVNGRVWSKKQNKFLSTKHNDIGYVYNTLTDDNGVATSYGVHRLIVSSNSGIPLEYFGRGKIEVDHVNPDLKHWNGIENLRMSDRKGQYISEVIRSKLGKSGKVLSNEDVIKFKEEFKEWEGKKIEFYKQVAEELGVVWQTVQYAILGYTHKNVTVNKGGESDAGAI